MGKFADSKIQNPGENYSEDIKWIKKANPMAALREQKYLERDYELLEKRRM